MRCPDIHNYGTSEKELTISSIQESYGLVSTAENNGRFDFRGSRLFMYGGSNGTQIAPSALIIGGCSMIDKSNRWIACPTVNFADKDGAITNVGRPTKLHHNKTVNLFSFDGHAETVDPESFAQNRYYPEQTGTNAGEALAVSSESLIDVI